MVLVGAQRSALMIKLTRADCVAAPDPDLRRQHQIHWLKCIIKPSPSSQMTEEQENSPWRADMYFRSAEVPQFKGLADVLERPQA